VSVGLQSRLPGVRAVAPPLPGIGGGAAVSSAPGIGGGAAVSSAPGIGGGAAVSSAPGHRGRGCSLGLQSQYQRARGLAALAAAEASGLGASGLASEKEKRTE
jgi:hypothetical protein